MFHQHLLFLFFFFNDTATTEIYTLSLHDALPISVIVAENGTEIGCHKILLTGNYDFMRNLMTLGLQGIHLYDLIHRSEEHTSELQSLRHLVCRLLLEKKKKRTSDAMNKILLIRSN